MGRLLDIARQAADERTAAASTNAVTMQNCVIPLVADQGDALPDHAAEARRLRVLKLLAANPSARYAVVTDSEGDPEGILLTLAIRGRATCELRIPRDRYDGALLLDLLERHGGTVH